jgi:Na+-driven multidrug efflux pump
MNDSWFDTYASFLPYVLVAVGILAYLLAGGMWWGVPIIGIAALLYSLFRVRFARWTKSQIDRRMTK